mgnify:CR=1 FL=1
MKRLRTTLIRSGIAIVGVAFIVLVVYIGWWYISGVFPDPDWTGFGTPKLNADGQEIAHFKTLWDWLGLLLVPAVLAIGGLLFTRAENERAQKREADRAQDAALQAYLDQMTQLLLDKGLRTSQPDDEVRGVARARTLTVLRVLDGMRKARVLQFLYEAKLIGGIKQETGGAPRTIEAVISLQGAYLEEAFLINADLAGVDLAGAVLNRAILTAANLAGANLDGAHLRGAMLGVANLHGAHLVKTRLREANLKGAHLIKANLEGAYLSEANVEGSCLIEANLKGADLRRAHLVNYSLGISTFTV